MVNVIIERVADMMQEHSNAVLANLDNIIRDYAKLRKVNDKHSLDMYNAVIQGGSQSITEHDERFIATLGGIVNQWNRKYSKNTISRSDTFRILAADFAEFHKCILEDKELHTIDGHLFNVFSLLSRYLGIGETLHSRLLHFLLSNDELHGQKNKFLLEFLKLADIYKPEGGVWEITSEIGRVDVMLQRSHPHSVVIIENKSNWAGDQANQLYRYWYKNIHRHTEDLDEKYYEGNDRYRIIYLAPNENKNYTEQTCCKPHSDNEHKIFKTDEEFNAAPCRVPLKPVTWTFNMQLQEWLERCMEILDGSNHPVREYIRQYKEYCKTL